MLCRIWLLTSLYAIISLEVLWNFTNKTSAKSSRRQSSIVHEIFSLEHSKRYCPYLQNLIFKVVSAYVISCKTTFGFLFEVQFTLNGPLAILSWLRGEALRSLISFLTI